MRFSPSLSFLRRSQLLDKREILDRELERAANGKPATVAGHTVIAYCAEQIERAVKSGEILSTIRHVP